MSDHWIENWTAGNQARLVALARRQRDQGAMTDEQVADVETFGLLSEHAATAVKPLWEWARKILRMMDEAISEEATDGITLLEVDLEMTAETEGDA